MKTFVFYHIFCKNLTHNIVKEQITKIIFSGLYDKVDAIYCFLAGEEVYIDENIELLKNSGKKFKIEEIGINDQSFERFTIHKIKNYIQPEDKFLYIHSKGILRNNDINVQDWKTYMEYFTIRHHERCLSLLDNYDTVGVNFYSCPFIHYSGNFWWSRGSYFLTLPDISTLTVTDDRYSYTENYIGLNNPKGFCLFTSGCPAHYANRYHINNYIDETSTGFSGTCPLK